MSVRQQMPFSSNANVQDVPLSLQTQTELVRIESIFADAKADFFWGEAPTAVDAFYSVMAFRLKSYGINFSGNAGRYQSSIMEWDFFKKSLKKIS